MGLTRQDRINLNKDKKGIASGEPGINDLSEGLPQFRTFFNHITGQQDVVQYIKNGSRVLKSTFKNVGVYESSAIQNWYLSEEVDISSGTGETDVLIIPSSTYVMDVRILITSAITAGSMDINVGIGTNTDVFIDGWDGTAGSTAVDTINAFGRGSSATETGVKVGKFFSTADTLVVDVDVVAGAGKIRLLALLMQNPLSNPVNP